MPTVDNARCPACGAGPGTLAIVERLVAAPLGTYSLAGAQLKASARVRPVLTCTACALEKAGEYDADGRHVTFQPP